MDIRMDAYYYGFDKTNVDCIDELLSSVACAGKAFHHTEEWMEEASAYGEHTIGKTPIDWIQNAAIKAAKEITSLRQQLAEQPNVDVLVEALAKVNELQRYSFLSPSEGGVRKFADKSGNWIEHYEVVKIIDNLLLATYQAKNEKE